jgi:cardiolipin synthase (CMP-forming)
MPDGSSLGGLPNDPKGGHRSGGWATLPNIISFARLCAVPLAVWLVLQQMMEAAFGLFLLAGLSDAVDGWLARRQGGGNKVGAVLDPIADKALMVSMYITLAAVHVLPDWLAILIVFRDVLIVGGVIMLFLLGHPPAIRPLPVSKLNTLLQIALVAVALLLSFAHQVPPRFAAAILQALIWAVTVCTLASGAAYVWIAARHR